MTNKLKHYGLAMMLGMGMMGASSAAQAEEVAVFADFGGYSQYIWRGAAQGAGEFSLQGDVGGDFGNGFSANVWFATGVGTDTEYDLTVDYSTDKFSVGYVHFAFMDSTFTADEIYVSSSYGPVSGLIAYDLDASDAYIEVSAGHSIEGVVDLSASAGFNTYENFTFGASRDFDMNSYTLSPSLTVGMAKGADTEVSVGVNASF